MSATIDIRGLPEFFSSLGAAFLSGHVHNPNRAFDEAVTRHRTRIPGAAVTRMAVDAALNALSSFQGARGAVLVFLSGEAAIMAACSQAHAMLKLMARKLRAADGEFLRRLHVCPLFAGLPPEQQKEAVPPSPAGTSTVNKLVSCTKVAETSLTVPNVGVVVDSGRVKWASFSPQTQDHALDDQRATQSEVRQRQSRAGRVRDGLCIQLFTDEQYIQMESCAPHAVRLADLTPLRLRQRRVLLADDQLSAELPAHSVDYAVRVLTGLQALPRDPVTSGPELSSPTTFRRTMGALPMEAHHMSARFRGRNIVFHFRSKLETKPMLGFLLHTSSMEMTETLSVEHIFSFAAVI